MKHVVRVLGVLALMMVLFVGCDMSMSESAFSRSAVQSEELSSRAVKSNGRTPFTAVVNLYQDYQSVVTEHKGNSNHYKTVEETLYSFPYESFGGVIESDWDLLDGKFVIMNNVTNYNLDPQTAELSGSNHSVIQIVDEQMQVVATLQANGTIDGSLLGAEIAMNWVLKDAPGKKIHANGKVGGIFTWADFDYETMGLSYILPNGTFTLTGSYK